MSAVLHPVGPEEPRTYWVRRATVLAVVLVVVLVAVWAFKPGGSDVQAVPAATPTPGATADAAEPGATPSATRSPAPSPSPTAPPTPTATATSSATSTASSSPTAGPSRTPEPSPTAEREESPAAEEERDEDARKKPAEPVACVSEDLRVTLTGSSRARIGEDHELELSVINGTGTSCELAVDGDSFELRIYSGADRIWTTDHCARWVPEKTVTLEPEEAHAWSMTWPGARSREDCELSETPLRPGTYVATAVYQKAKPVQLVMTLG
ncbi:hypothetical protein GC722_13305 [Auraticoccus sp. F435]|uniref:DUF4232 domain-containing protein n=1 Tax=Auraticoccus cholistanensis TaxID=2656650 RepID=A0A6A9UVX4_9ACTN|nr:hypothetical protein [Auraticoccus cholistanensis]MVA76993.1 hypothetical protein [Auraticoccus cholistanensis]